MSGEGVPTLQADQLNVIAHHLHTMKTKEDLWTDISDWSVPIDSPDVMTERLKISRLKRRRVQQTDIWDKFHKSEWKQLNRYDKVGMFGEPFIAPMDATKLPWVWTYLFKENSLTAVEEPKARSTYNGCKRYDEAVTLAETYAACVKQIAHRLTWTLPAALGLTCIGYDVGNTFAEAPAPTQPFYMRLDAQFREWRTECLGRPPLGEHEVIPVLKALQGHPESPCLWDKYISKILADELGFTPSTNAPCLYYKRDANGELILVLRQVDDF